MLLSLAGKHRKKVASALLVIMYLQCVIPVHASIGQDFENYKDYRYYKPKYSVSDFNFSRIEKKLPDPVKKDTVIRNEQLQQADIGGPGQPEMSSFKSVNADNMVDLFTGDFSYNIPL